MQKKMVRQSLWKTLYKVYAFSGLVPANSITVETSWAARQRRRVGCFKFPEENHDDHGSPASAEFLKSVLV